MRATRAAVAVAAALLGGSSAARLAHGSWDWDGQLEARSEWAVETHSANTSKFELAIAPELALELPAGARVVGRLRARADALDQLGSSEPGAGDGPALSSPWLSGGHGELELRELYADLDLGETAVRVGKQQIVWGKADGLKLLDVVNPSDFREFILEDFEDSRIPQWSLSLERELGALSAQAIWTPDSAVHRFPAAGQAFALRSPVLVPQIPAGVPVAVRPVRRPHWGWRDSDAGVRISSFWNGSHVTLNYLYRYDDAPTFYRQLPRVPGAPLVVSPRHERQHVLGGSFSTASGAWVVRGEAAVALGATQFTADLRDADGVVRTQDWRAVLGLDWSPRSHTLISAQLFQSTLGGDFPGLGRDRSERTLTLLARRQFRNDTWTAEGLWIQDLNRSDGLLRLRLEHALADDVALWLRLDVFFGRERGVFGQFGERDRIALGAELHF